MSGAQSVLLISDGLIHPHVAARWFLRQALSGASLTHARSLNALHQHQLEAFQAIVLYMHHQSADPDAIALLDAFVQQGGGLLAIHSASASFKAQSEYYAI
ncbi:MAG: hypothetical protein GYB68_06505, partial [Chloroflexi bacterium]|nr:hypothetical protein [Chloroflexota bacterium]